MRPVSNQRLQSGMSLIELMVAMLIGLFTTLVIMQVFSVFEGEKRTSTTGADAQTSSAIALYNIGRQVAMAGFGLPTFSTKTPPLLCANSALAFGGINLFPVAIVDGGAGASDSIAIRMGTSQSGGIPIKALSATNPVGVSNSDPCTVGDVVLVATSNVCSVTTVTAVPDTTHVTLASVAGVTANSTTLSCLGQWTERRYQVAGGNMTLTTTTNGVATTADNVEGVVNIQAQYGVSGVATSNDIASWVDATGNFQNPDIATRNRIKAIRIAIVARSGLYEKDVVTSGPNCAGSSSLCAWNGDAPIDISAVADYGHYRYKVVESVIPVRNIVWTKGTMTP